MVKRCNLHAIGVLGQEDRKNGAEAIFEEMIAENVPVLMKASSHKLKKLNESHRINTKQITLGNTIVKVQKTKDKKKKQEEAGEKTSSKDQQNIETEFSEEKMGTTQMNESIVYIFM